MALPAQALPTTGNKGMVSSAHPLASQAGIEMLRAGGNAVDAAVATAFALAVVEPYSSGIGGGGFALVSMGQEPRFFDFREIAPAAATRDMYLVEGKPDPSRSQDGIFAVAVPGAVRGYVELQQTLGKLRRDQVLAPAIRLAEHGFLIEPRYLDYVASRRALLERDPEATRTFLRVTGPGERLIQPELASTLKAIAKDGARAFYEGAVAKKLVADMQARGGLVTLDDLRNYKMVERKPLVRTSPARTIVTAPPPSAGGVVVIALLELLQARLASTPARPEDREALAWHSPASLHFYIEASKRVFADRHLIGDPGFVPDLTAALLDEKRLRKLAQRIGAKAEPALSIPPAQDAELAPGTKVPNVFGKPEGGNDTTHLCVIDKDGHGVSLTTTVNYGFGAGVVAKGTGVLWNNEMDDFAIAPGVPNVYGVVGAEVNAIAPGKRPVSSMAPTLVFAGERFDELTLCVGSPGGPRIPTTVAQAIWNYDHFKMDVEQAIDAPRVHQQHLPDEVGIEPFALEPLTKAALHKLGHKLVEQLPWSNATIIARDPKNHLTTGAADRRGIGTAIAE